VLAALLAIVAGTAGCGTPAADLFVVERSGDLPDADVRLLVSDDGMVRCDGGEPRQMADGRLLEARDLARDLAPLLDRGLHLQPAPGSESLLRYEVLGGEGEASFADTSPELPPALARVQRFTRTVARESCGLDR
jgi:hypothetical protein